jgi:DMSO/TMAO reductase YedYZ molybdopterin-dependent catalytic subunit
MFGMDQNKTQEERILTPEDAAGGVIVSPDTRRANRVPPGQSRTKKWPTLDTSGPPPISIERWKFSISGLVARPTEWNWSQFQELERVQVFSDFLAEDALVAFLHDGAPLTDEHGGPARLTVR